MFTSTIKDKAKQKAHQKVAMVHLVNFAQLKFITSAEICHLKTNTAWQNDCHDETVHRRVKPTFIEVLVLT